jgi:hypothetical protein
VHKEKGMKIAICISGFPRIMKYSYPYLKKYILDELNPDIFYSGYIDKDNLIEEEDIVNLYNPKRHFIREWNDSVKEEIWDDYGSREIRQIQPPTNVEATLSQRWNIWKANELKKEIEKDENFTYDVVFRIRTDYYFYRCPNTEELSTTEKLCIPSNGWDHGGVTDGFAFGTSCLMDVYSNCFFKINEYHLKDCQTFHPEKMLKYHLDKHGISRKIVDPHFCWRLSHFHENQLTSKLIKGIEKDPENFREKYT